MKVSKEWLVAFNFVMTYMALRPDDIDECKAEARQHEAWALEFYPRAAALIRSATTGA